MNEKEIALRFINNHTTIPAISDQEAWKRIFHNQDWYNKTFINGKYNSIINEYVSFLIQSAWKMEEAIEQNINLINIDNVWYLIYNKRVVLLITWEHKRMTDNDKINISKIDMAKVKGLIKKLSTLEQQYYDLGLCTQGTGIDYSRDRIQTSPTNAIESLCIERADGIELYKNTMNEILNYKSIVDRIQRVDYYNVIINIAFNGYTFRQYADRINKTPSYIHKLYNKALISYYNKKHNI